MIIPDATAIVEAETRDFRRPDRQHCPPEMVVATLREMGEQADDPAACHDLEREADRRPRRRARAA